MVQVYQTAKQAMPLATWNPSRPPGLIALRPLKKEKPRQFQVAIGRVHSSPRMLCRHNDFVLTSYNVQQGYTPRRTKASPGSVASGGVPRSAVTAVRVS